jgi:hypothetical protein
MQLYAIKETKTKQRQTSLHYQEIVWDIRPAPTVTRISYIQCGPCRVPKFRVVTKGEQFLSPEYRSENPHDN